MSFAKIKELDNYLIANHGVGIEELVVETPVFEKLMVDVASLRQYDSQFPDDTISTATNIKFGEIIITRSVRDRIKETEAEIAKLQDDLAKLKTRTGY